MKDIFDTESPVFAEWYSGNIKIGLGETIHGSYSIYNETYLVCTIVEGVITNKFFVEPAYEEDKIIDFGKHKSRSIVSVIKGGLDFFIAEKIRDYLISLINFYVSSEAVQSILIPDFRNLQKPEKKLTRESLSKNKIDLIVSKDFIAFREGERIIGDDNEFTSITKLFSEFLESLLKLKFENLITYKRTANFIEGINKTSLAIEPDYSYIIWAIKTVKEFYVPPQILERKFEIKKIQTFSIKRIHGTIFQYEPMFTSFEYSFPEAIKIMNQKKFEDITKKKFDKENRWYILSDNDQSNQKSKYFTSPNDDQYKWSDDELKYADLDYNHNNPAHDPDENSWIDVFGPGEDAETAYWNTD